MKTITFIRHGQSVANAGGITVAHHAIPLSELGELQATALSKLLPEQPSLILTSSFIRAQQTATPFTTRVGKAAEVHSLVHEFDNFDLNLIAGMNGAQREPLREAFWQEADPNKRMGIAAETFAEFDQRVQTFLPHSQDLPDQTMVFGHGMWIGMLIWKLLGFSASDSLGMKSFRRFQTGLPMPNCAVYHFREVASGHWHARADEVIMRKLSEVQ
jgi:broad specificity phosphatase PhoE